MNYLLSKRALNRSQECRCRTPCQTGPCAVRSPGMWRWSGVGTGLVPPWHESRHSSWVEDPARAQGESLHLRLHVWVAGQVLGWKSRTGALLVTAELQGLQTQREDKTAPANWALAVGSETKWPIMADFDPTRNLLIFKPILAGIC